MKQTNKQTNPIRVSAETYDALKFLANKSNKSITATLAEIVDAVFNVACCYESLNLEYEYSENTVKIVASGRSNLICSEQKMPDSVLKEESKAEPLLKVKFKGEKEFVELKK